MIVKRTACVVLLVLTFHWAGVARRKVYEQGKVVDFAPKYIDWPIIAIGPTRMLIGYELQIQVAQDTYFVKVATCCLFQRDLEWSVGDLVEFRADKGKMFIKRPRGKELNASLVKVVPGIASPSLFTRPIVSATPF